MTMETARPSFATAYAETSRMYTDAGLDAAELSYLTEELFETLLAATADGAGTGSRSAAGETISRVPGEQEIGELIHDAIFLGGDRVLGYLAGAAGLCPNLVPVDTFGQAIFVRRCGSGGGPIWKIMPV